MRRTVSLRVALMSTVTAAIAAAGPAFAAASPIAAAPARAPAAAPAADTVHVQNGAVRFGFDTRNGALLELTDVASGHTFVTGASAVWRLDLPGADGVGIGPADAGRFEWRQLSGAEHGVVLSWSEFGRADAPRLRVTATVTLQDGAALSDWRIALDSMGDLRVEQVHFPRVERIAAQPGEELIVPRWMGTLARDPEAALRDTAGAPRRLEYSYPGTLSLQLLALYARGGPGFYAAADDTLSYRKSFAVWSAADGTRGYEMVHPLEDPDATRASWSPQYAAVVGTFNGDWITAAELYRGWGVRQRWARESRLRRGLVPDWLRETGMWVWNRGRSPGVLPPARALQDTLGLPVSVFWHWWHQGPYDTSFPDYLPPREGAAPFRRAVDDAHAAGLHAIVYMNQRLWCTGQPSWGPEAAAAAVKERDGTVRTEVYNIFDPQPCATMDVTTQYWRDHYAGIADEVLDEYGLDGIYMDQAVLSLVCWDPSHDHPLGGGNYWMDGFRRLASQIRAGATPGRPVLLAGEGAGEPWLPELDLMLTLQVSQERYSDPASGWEPIPLFQAVYHAYGITYGSYSSLVMPPYDDLWPAETAPADSLALLDERFSRQFRLEQARSFVWGLQPTIANFRASQLADRPHDTAYMMHLARLRTRALDYLQLGTFLRPPELDVAETDVELSRVSIYAARRGGPTVSHGRFPAAIAGAWRADDGNVAIALASILDEPVTVSFVLDPHAYGLTGEGVIERIDVDGSRRFGRWAEEERTPIRLELAAGFATIIEFRRDGNR